MILKKVPQKVVSLTLGTLVVSVLAILPSAALAVGAASFPQATNIQITVSGTLYTLEILGGSDADSLTVDGTGGTFTVAVTSGEHFIIKSSDGLRLTNNGSITDTCSSGIATLDIPSTTTATVTVTPNGDRCSTGGGGTSGGGGGPAPTPTPTPTPTATPSVTPTPTPTPSATPNPSTPPSTVPPATGQTPSGIQNRGLVTAKFVHTLALGSRGPEVKALQQKLKDLGFFPRTAAVNGIFGTTTLKAVRAFQKAHRLLPIGIIGPLTRAALNK